MNRTIFDITHRGYRILAIDVGDGDATVQISKVIQEFHWPTYKIWNISAHVDDIVDSLEECSCHFGSVCSAACARGSHHDGCVKQE